MSINQSYSSIRSPQAKPLVVKLLQLNMWGGTHFPIIKDFLEKNDFDILCFQEVTGPNTHCGNLHSLEDQYKKLQEVLGATHNSQLFADIIFTSDPQHSFEGNAIFYKKHFTLKEKKVITLFEGQKPFPSDATSYEDMPRGLIEVSLETPEKTLRVVCTHLAWAPTPLEQPHQREQNKKLVSYIKHLPSPWILTGDFNIQPDQPTILDLEKYGFDLTKDYNVPNTLDSTIHRAWEKIKPGFPVDYIFVSPGISVTSFEALDTIHMSDHIGLTATVEI